MRERTFSIIKPDAVKAQQAGDILARIEKASFTLVLERENAIAHLREIMGATDPAKAAAGTIRKDFASSIEANAVHGSDAPPTAAFEISYFFGALELQ